jgi:FkbM family methyltransferase
MMNTKDPQMETGASAPSPLEIYSGYTDEDIVQLRSFVVQRASLGDDAYIDGFSQKTPFDSVSFCTTFNLERLTFPVPDDGVHAEAPEYIALCDSISHAGKEYCIAELGAGWGPWISLAGVIARTQGIKSITLIGVEAHPERFQLMKRQLAANHLRPPEAPTDTTEINGVKCRLIHGAVASQHKKVWFPSVDVKDMGAAASDNGTSRDYRGLKVKSLPVDGYTIQEIIGRSNVDFMHIDIQGAEYDVVSSAIGLVNAHVKSMLVATHSRVIEGKLIELLYKNGWHMHREKPCRVAWAFHPPSLESMTEIDGCQYWRREA